jgi:hypothetical protein
MSDGRVLEGSMPVLLVPVLLQVGPSDSPALGIVLYVGQYIAVIAVVLIFWWILRKRIRAINARFRETRPLAVVVALAGAGLFVQGFMRARELSGSISPNISNPMAAVGVAVFCTGLAFLLFAGKRGSTAAPR